MEHVFFSVFQPMHDAYLRFTCLWEKLLSPLLYNYVDNVSSYTDPSYGRDRHRQQPTSYKKSYLSFPAFVPYWATPRERKEKSLPSDDDRRKPLPPEERVYLHRRVTITTLHIHPVRYYNTVRHGMTMWGTLPANRYYLLLTEGKSLAYLR